MFDCDGTLVDSQASICAAMESAFASVALPPPPRSAIRRIVGLSVPEAARTLHPDGDPALLGQIGEAYRSSFLALRQSGALEEPLFDGMAALIARLHAAGWLLGVATGKSDRGLARTLAAHGLEGRFVTLQTADRHPSKPDPAMLEAALNEAGVAAAEAVMIGDTRFDVEMAVAAGVRAIGVGWGYHPPEELHAAGAELVVEDCDALFAVLEQAR